MSIFLILLVIID